jgi:hypothetical protein
VDRVVELVEDWAARAEPLGLLSTEGASSASVSRAATIAELATWTRLVLAAADGDADARDELGQLVALEARSRGLADRPPSPLVRTLALLDDVARARGLALHAELDALIAIAVDAHALGVEDAARARQEALLREHTPVHVLGDVVVAHLLGATTPGNVDALLGRVVHAAAGSAATRVVLDVSGARGVDPRLADAIAETAAKISASRPVVLVLVGARALPGLVGLLAERPLGQARVALADTLADALPAR